MTDEGSAALLAAATLTHDDRTFDSLVELDAIPYVGPVVLETLIRHAEATGKIDAGGLGRHDVSVLLPLPPVGADLQWTSSTPGLGGALLPRAVFDQIGRSVFKDVDDSQEYDALRVVGVRFDPCFMTSLTAACQPQIRLVFQPLTATGGTHDGGIHALYNLSAAQWTAVVAGLRELVAVAPENRAFEPLGVSPALRAQGFDGPYARGLGALITANAGASNLARMTFMTRTQARQGEWELGGFHVQAQPSTGFPAPGPISILGGVLQVVGNSGFGTFAYGAMPEIADAAGRPGLTAAGLQALDAETRAGVAAWAAAQNSPIAHVPDTTDCASCHVAGHVGRALAAIDPALTDFGGPRTLTIVDAQGDNLRSFGYFNKYAHVAPRTANETAAVVQALANDR